jgi:HPt (histidine-containing phosphotransfer) domain-containing protein
MNNLDGIDPQGVVRLQKIGGPDFLRKMIDLFLAEAPKRLSAARSGERAGDLKAVADAVHSLKSSAGNFGAERLSRAAGKIELLTRSNSSENLSRLLDDLDLAYGETKAWLEKHRESLK